MPPSTSPANKTNALVRRVDHIAMAVPDLESSAHLYGDVLGGRFLNGGDSIEDGIRTIQFDYPSGSKIELLAPLDQDSRLWTFLAKRGPGMHHVTLLVEDVSRAISEVAEAGFELVDQDVSSPRWREVFTRPASTHGVLIQFAETDIDWTVPRNTNVDLEAVLAGKVTWRGHQCQLDG